MSRRFLLVVTTTSACLALPQSSMAANADFQDFFFDVCVNPTGVLAARCAETTGALGNLSGDSESSLNPSQSLSSNDSQVSQARIRGKQARERGERLRDRDSGDSEVAAPSNPMSLLVHTRAGSFESDRVVDLDAERGLEGDTWGAEIGFDYRISSTAFIGAIVGFEQTDSDFVAENPGNNFTPATSAGDIADDSLSITLFGSINPTESFFFEGSLGYVSSDFEFRRNSVFQESNRIIAQTNANTLGETDGDVIWAGINFGLNKQRNAVTFGPYFGATYASSTVDAYTEQDRNGSGLAMSYADIERDSMIAHAGFRVGVAKSTEGGVVLPQFRIEYQHESEDPSQVAASFLLDASSTQYALIGDEPDRDHFETGFGVAWVLPNGWQPFFDLEVLTGNDEFDRYRVAAGFRVEF